MRILGKFMKELRGLLSYIYLLQSSIECFSHLRPISDPIVVYRGMSSCDSDIVSIYESMIGQLIVWPGFTSTSRKFDYVIDTFVKSGHGMLFEIFLHPGDTAAEIGQFSDIPGESEILIAASSVYRVDAVTEIEVLTGDPVDSRSFSVTKVTLTYEISWYDFDLDAPPPHFIINEGTPKTEFDQSNPFMRSSKPHPQELSSDSKDGMSATFDEIGEEISSFR
jgi:hypothetical protein